jgi:predicted nucleic acid-binding protein
MAKTVIVDTGYWLALWDAKDSYHCEAKPKAHHIENLDVVFPWPTLYETLCTRFVKNRLGMDNLNRVLRRPNVHFIDDISYREIAFEKTFEESRRGKRSISLCDMMIRLILIEKNLRIDSLLTFNVRDFHDVCRIAKIEIL